MAERDLLAGPDVERGDRAQVFAMDRGRSRQRQPVGAGDCGHPAIIESPHLRDDRAVLAADDAGQLSDMVDQNTWNRERINANLPNIDLEQLVRASAGTGDRVLPLDHTPLSYAATSRNPRLSILPHLTQLT
ncbi:MAG TPA: hypothetical protein VHY56_05410 [Candidatus Binataceae bacterium]|nr:hypothetical protein [Candidatus Binataceae bacterium]